MRKKPPDETSPICYTTARYEAKNPAPIPAMYMNGSTIHGEKARRAVNVIELMPITSSASISSEIRIAQLGHDPRADLRAHHVAERVRHDLAQVAPGGEHARLPRARRAAEVRALDAALQAEDEAQAPDHERRAHDQDARLAKSLAEEPEHAPAEHLAEDDPRRELRDVAEARDPVLRKESQPAPISAASRTCAPAYLITEISGWVARRVWVKT